MTRLHAPAPRAHLRPSAKFWAYGALIAGGAGVLAACGHSAPTRFFTLDPVAPAAPPAATYAATPVKVLAVNIPPSLDREELVSEEAGGEIRVHDFEHWEAPLGQTARQALIQDLAVRLPAGAVLGPAAPSSPGVAALTVDVIAFRSGPEGGGASLLVGWSVSLPGASGAPSPLVWRAPLVELKSSGSGSGSGVGGAATAQAFSALLGQLADQVAARLPSELARLQADQQETIRQARAAEEAAKPRPRTTTTTTQTTTRRATASAPQG